MQLYNGQGTHLSFLQAITSLYYISFRNRCINEDSWTLTHKQCTQGTTFSSLNRFQYQLNWPKTIHYSKKRRKKKQQQQIVSIWCVLPSSGSPHSTTIIHTYIDINNKDLQIAARQEISTNFRLFSFLASHLFLFLSGLAVQFFTVLLYPFLRYCYWFVLWLFSLKILPSIKYITNVHIICGIPNERSVKEERVWGGGGWGRGKLLQGKNGPLQQQQQQYNQI